MSRSAEPGPFSIMEEDIRKTVINSAPAFQVSLQSTDVTAAHTADLYIV